MSEVGADVFRKLGAALAGTDRRSRLPEALDALLRAPVLTAKVLAARLKIAPQTASALLRELQAKGLVREVTGRGRFRAFAV
jgi:Fic family protein